MGTKPNTSPFQHEWLWLEELRVHPKVQRGFKKKWAEHIAANFDPDAFGEIYVTRAAKGYLIWDGQHRVAAAKIALGEKQKVYCRVYDLDTADVADRSLKLNDAKRWMALDRFGLRVISGEPTALAIKKTLGKYGLCVGRSRGPAVVQAVTACDWVFTKAGGAETLDWVVRILNGAWGRDPDAYDQRLLRGAALVCNRYNGDIHDADLQDKLSKQGGPGRLLGRARDLAKAAGESVPRAVAEVITNEYNKGRRTTRLAEWRS